MNKAIATLFLAVAFSSAVLALPAKQEEIDDDYSQLALFEEDPVEIAGLAANRKLFADFCLRSRDNVKLFLKESANTGAKRVFNILFNSEDDYDEIDVEEFDEEDVEVSAKIIQDRIKTSQPTKAASSDEESMEERVEAVKRSSVWSTLSQAVRVVLNSAIEFISSTAAKRLAKLRSRFTPEEIKAFIKDSCDSISYSLKSQLSNSLRETQTELLNLGLDKPTEQAIATARIEDVGCVTTGRVAMVNKVCGFLGVAGHAIYPLFGL